MSRTLSVRALDSRSLVGLTRTARDLLTPAARIESPYEVFWTDNDLARGSIVQPTGSQTIARTNPALAHQLSVTGISGFAATDLGAIMFPADIQVGQKWRVATRSTWTSNQFLMTGFVFSNGVAPSSDITGLLGYTNAAGQKRWDNLGGGTFDAVAIDSGANLATGQNNYPFVLELEYAAPNSFNTVVYTGDGANVWRASANVTTTLTPTHIGVGWSNWGASPTNPEVRFGPIYRVA